MSKLKPTPDRSIDFAPLGYDRRKHVPRTLRGLLVIVCAFSFSLGYGLYRWDDARRYPLRPLTMAGHWIQAPGEPGYAGYFRRHVSIRGNVKNAWLCVAACDGFEVTVNRNPVCRQFLWRPTRPFQNGLSEKGQRITTPQSSLAMNFPREYQWTGHDNFRLPVFVDIGPELRHGDNVICVKIESRRAPAKVMIDGRVTLQTGEMVSLKSDSQWCAEPIPRGSLSLDWTEPAFPDRTWNFAQPARPPSGQLWCAFDRQLYAHPFGGWWLRHPDANGQQAVWFQATWNLPAQPTTAWIRLATNRYFDLFINDVRVRAPYTYPPDLDSGQWIIERKRATDMPAAPTLLDPDEVDRVYAGDGYLDPRHGDPTVDQHVPRELFRHEFHHIVRPSGRLDLPGNYDPTRALAESRHPHDRPDAFPQPVKPTSLHRERGHGGFMAFDVTRLLQRGQNRIEIRLSEPETVAPFNWPSCVAMDGQAEMESGERVSLHPRDVRTCASSVRNPCVTSGWLPALASQAGNVPGSPLPRLQYRGAARLSSLSLGRASQWMLGTAAVTASICGTLFVPLWCGLPSRNRSATVVHLARLIYGMLLAATFVLSTVILLEICWAERHELLWFRHGKTWERAIWASVCVALAAVRSICSSARAEFVAARRCAPVISPCGNCRNLAGGHT